MHSILIISVVTLAISSVAFGKHPKHLAKEKLEASEWTIYQYADFNQHDLCQILNCRKSEVCLVRDNQALCVHKDKLHDIEGKKQHFQKFKEHHEKKEEKEVKDDSVDEKHREKLAKYHAKLQKHDAKNDKVKNEYYKPTHHADKPRTHQEAKEIEARCPEQELKNIIGRLLQWFSDVHNVEKNSGIVKTLPKHHVSCRAEVGWMFGQWDGDDDGLLTEDELKSLEDDKYEQCIRPFLDKCDVNADDFISLDEWCDCFQWTGYERKEPACHAARRKYDPHMLGAFHPRCDVDGYFRPEQCHERMCWCADRFGREFDHSRAHGRADCGQYAEKDSDDEDLRDFEASGDGKREL